MPSIVLTQEQTRVLTETKERIKVYDQEGRLMCFMDWFGTPLEDVIAECKRRQASGEPGIPSAQVQAHLRKLEEIRQREGMDEAKMWELLRRMRRGGGMKTYTVDWEPEAESDLTVIWLRTSDPMTTIAQNQIDDLLERNPTGYGRLLQEGLYQIMVAPLTAFYSIDQAKKIVKVSAVWYTP